MKLRLLSNIPLSNWEERLIAYVYLRSLTIDLCILGDEERLRVHSGMVFINKLSKPLAQEISLNAFEEGSEGVGVNPSSILTKRCYVA